MSRILVISPHPDDESIGCGGAPRKHFDEGATIQAILLTSGEKRGRGRPEAETAARRKRQARRAIEILGLESAEFWKLGDGAVRATKALRAHLAQRTLAAQSDGVDRRTVSMYEVWTPMVRMTHTVDISPYLEVKFAAIRAHETQCSVLRFDDAMLGLARCRGEMHSWFGGEYADVFREVRQ